MRSITLPQVHLGAGLLVRSFFMRHVRHPNVFTDHARVTITPRYALAHCLSLVLPDVQVIRKPNSPLLALFEPVIAASGIVSAPEYTISLLHHCSSLLRVSLALLNSPHTIPLPPHTFPPSPLFDLVFVVLSTTPSSLAHQPPPQNIFASIIPPFLPALHMDAVAFFTGEVPFVHKSNSRL